MFEPKQNVAIIGGGISGMAMALCLHSLSIPCTVYERRVSHSGNRTDGGGMMIAANALRILDSWGVYAKMVPKGYPFKWVFYKDANEDTIDRYPFGDKDLYGYDAIRIYRQQLIEILYETCKERGIPIEFNQKFTEIIEETDAGVTFRLADGSIHTAQMLIGADGIHSKIRDYVSPGATTNFINIMAVTYEVEAAQLRIPADKNYEFPVQITTNDGIMVLAPQTPDGSLMLAGTQYPTHDRTREEWESLYQDKSSLKQLVRRDYERWPAVVQSAMENIKDETMNVWPFYFLSKVGTWSSVPHRRVVIIGDAAHALPPTLGQGASQAFEDVFSLGLLIAAARQHPGELSWPDAFRFWQDMRQERIDQLLALTKQLNNKRLPAAEQALLPDSEIWRDESAQNSRQMAWLYQPEIEKTVDSWISETMAEK